MKNKDEGLTSSPNDSNAFVTGSLSFVKFKPDNNMRYGQDFGFLKDIPSDIQFYPIEETSNGLMVFVGDKHGIRPHHNLQGTYGNGAIYVFKSDMSDELIAWCRSNFL